LNGGRPGAVVIGGHVNGLGIVRALAAKGVANAVIRTKPCDFAHLSRWVCAHESAMASSDEPESLVEILERRSPDWRAWALLQTNDEALKALSLYRDRLSANYRVLAPPWDVGCQLLDKELMFSAARAAGLALPRSFGVAGKPGMEAVAMPFPVGVKPFESHRFMARFGCKLLPASTPMELRAQIARLQSAGFR